MTSIIQDSKYNRIVTVREIVAASPGNRDQQYARWLEDKASTPPYCSLHPQTKLLPAVGPSDADLLEIMRDGQEVDPEVESLFKAYFFCPTCRRAYALFPAEFLHSSFETFNTDTRERADSLALARAYSDQVNTTGGGFLVFVGRPGTGKTRLAAGVTGNLRSRNALYVRQAVLISAHRATYGRNNYELDNHERKREVTTPLEIAQNAGLLVLDEIGCTAPANDERVMLDELLKHRYEQRKPTILISNLPLKLLMEFFGDALADRINHATGNGKFIFTSTAESYRRSSGKDYLTSLCEAA